MTAIPKKEFDYSTGGEESGASFRIKFEDPFREARDSLEGALTDAVYVFTGTSIVKSLGGFVARKFFESDPLPFKVNYVDWWPRICQKVKEFASSFWARRAEGATFSTSASFMLAVPYLLQDRNDTASTIWSLAKKTTTSFLNLFGYTPARSFTADLLTFSTLPSLVGLGATLALGSYDRISKYFSKDLILETKPIFNQELQTSLDEILDTVRENKKDKSFLQNLLLFGPPGTGKTMISKWIAKNSDMNYIFISGGDLLKGGTGSKEGAQGGAGPVVAMLQKLIEHAKSFTSPTVIFIDEAEACLAKRSAAKSQELVSLLNAFLQLTGQPTSKMMLILATNRPDDLDSAVLSRMDYSIEVGPPDTAERKNIVKANVPILFNHPQEQNLFSDPLLNHIAEQTKGFSGRDLFKLLNRFKVAIRKTKPLDKQLTGTQQTKGLDKEMIDKIIENFVKQEKKIATFKNSENPIRTNPIYANIEADGPPVLVAGR